MISLHYDQRGYITVKEGLGKIGKGPFERDVFFMFGPENNDIPGRVEWDAMGALLRKLKVGSLFILEYNNIAEVLFIGTGRFGDLKRMRTLDVNDKLVPLVEDMKDVGPGENATEKERFKEEDIVVVMKAVIVGHFPKNYWDPMPGKYGSVSLSQELDLILENGYRP